MNVILCGYHWTGCKALEILRAMNHNVFVYTHKAQYQIPSLLEYCGKVNVPYSLENVSKVDLPFNPDVICSISYRYIIKEHIINTCSGRIFNLHPSLLPKYRGCSSLTWAMINGEKEAGYTYHYVNPSIDTGDIILQEPLPIEEFDTQETLFVRTMVESMKMFSTAFEHVFKGLPGKKQEGAASSFKRGCPHDGVINPDWDHDYKERFIRAMIYPPYPAARYNDREIFSIHDLPD
jgi:methionyl-tRNA formyltransferase